jgi:RHS repeat-associated protein
MSRTADPQNIPQTRLGFASRETSVGGLLYNRARHYDTSSGRFLQQDAYRGDDLQPPSLHRYTYVHNNPVRYTDPTGHMIQEDMVRFILTFAALYAVAIGLVCLGLELGGIDSDNVLTFGAELITYILLVTLMFVLLDKYGPRIAAAGRGLLAGAIATGQEIVRGRGTVHSVPAKAAITVMYVIVQLILVLSKGAVSGRFLGIMVRNIQNFWRTGIVAELAKGPEMM